MEPNQNTISTCGKLESDGTLGALIVELSTQGWTAHEIQFYLARRLPYETTLRLYDTMEETCIPPLYDDDASDFASGANEKSSHIRGSVS